jgi:hypothetical protein
MIPADVLHKIRLVIIHYNQDYNYIRGFSFFDKDGALLWEIGWTKSYISEKETVLLEEIEVIVGVVAKLRRGDQSVYTDF